MNELPNKTDVAPQYCLSFAAYNVYAHTRPAIVDFCSRGRQTRQVTDLH
jgi:hypothetical protein